jgi:hypothetical protein
MLNKIFLSVYTCGYDNKRVWVKVRVKVRVRVRVIIKVRVRVH